MQLNDLFQKAGVVATPLPFPFGDAIVHDIKADSRRIGPFDVFVSIPCPGCEDFLEDALNRGCRVVVAESELCDNPLFQKFDALAIPHENPRLILSKLAAAFYGAGPNHVVAVTGTNGKSSTVHFVRQFWEALHLPCASIGTLGLNLSANISPPFDYSDILEGASLTTLDALRLHPLMARLHSNGIDHLAFEASSHGLDQYRMHGVQLSAAAFTNLTQDHLDYHQTMEDYFKAKAKLFSEILPHGGTAVLNKDIPCFEDLLVICKDRGHKIITFSRQNEADLFVSNLRIQDQSQIFDLKIFGKKTHNLHVSISGDFQIENIMAALGLMLASGISVDDCLPTFAKLTTAAGRLERVHIHNNVAIYVDFAHTPDALEKVLQTLKPYTKEKIWIVFGCGGNRDRGKRPLIGKIAYDYADHCIITDDNPRFEDPKEIRAQIMAGMGIEAADQTIHPLKVIEIANRSEAIEYAILNATSGDTILIAGKGHERGQLIGNTLFAFDDRLEIMAILEKNFKS